MKNIFIAILLTFNLSALSNEIDSKQKISEIILDFEVQTSFHEWEGSINHPDNWFNELSQTPIKNSDLIEICKNLSSLKPDSLSIFFNTLEMHNFSESLFCKNQLISKIKNYYLKSKIQLEQKNSYFNKKNLNQIKSTLGPSIELNLDTSTGPTFITADLPEKYIALTFDDGPHNSLTEELLTILKNQNVHATFFMVGQNVLSRPHIVHKVQVEGHTIGNHSYNHPDMRKLSYTNAKRNIEDGFLAILNTIGNSAPFFRFPYGARTSLLTKFVKENQWGSFLWNIDTLDWKYKNPEFLLNYALEQIEKNQKGIALFHDVQPQTIAIMPTLLNILNEKEYKTVLFKSDLISELD